MFLCNAFWDVNLSFIIALIALFYSVREIKRNNKIIIKIKDCSNGLQQSIDENNGQSFSYFKVTIQNEGINLYSPKMCLSFMHEKGGTFSVSLNQKIHSNFPVDTFSKGMITTFHFKTYELDESQRHFLSMLKNCHTQDACLCLYSQSYLAKKFPVKSLLDRTKKQWNCLSWKLSFKRKKGTNWEGADIVKHYQLPIFQTYADKLDYFIKSYPYDMEMSKESNKF